METWREKMRNTLLACLVVLFGVTIHPASASAQEVLLSEDFSSGFPPSWTHYNGSLSVVGGVLDLGFGCVILPGTFDRAEGIAIEADVNITWAAAGDFNIFAFLDLFAAPAPHCLYIVDEGYGFDVYPIGSDNPQDHLDAVVGGVRNRATAPATTVAGVWTRVRAEMHSDGTLRLLTNGVEQITNFDNLTSRGPIVLRTWGSVLIDNVQVETLDSCSFGPPDQPLTFTRKKGKPDLLEVSWDSCGGAGSIQFQSDSLSAASVKLNDLSVLSSLDLNQGVPSLKVPVVLVDGTNHLTVQLRSKPGSGLTLTFEPAI